MSFLLPCPNCGSRSAYEFQFGGEYHVRPTADALKQAWVEYLYLRTNSTGEQIEWWYHRMGCRLWFLALRNTSTNHVLRTFWPEEIQTLSIGRNESLVTEAQEQITGHE